MNKMAIVPSGSGIPAMMKKRYGEISGILEVSV